MDRDLETDNSLFELTSIESQDSNIFSISRILIFFKNASYKIHLKLFSYSYTSSELEKTQLI